MMKPGFAQKAPTSDIDEIRPKFSYSHTSAGFSTMSHGESEVVWKGKTGDLFER